MCKSITKEDVVTMKDERITELEQALEKAKTDHAGVMKMYENANKRYLDDTNILASVLYNIIDYCGLEKHHLDTAIANSSYESDKVIQTLQFHEAVPNELLTRDYYVSVTVPVTVCVRVTAPDEGTAEEIGRDEVESNGIESYDMEYNLYYDAECSVEEA
jgi:hypothetical protein